MQTRETKYRQACHRAEIGFSNLAPFAGSFFAFAVNREKLAVEFFIGLVLMLAGTVFVVYDMMINLYLHVHTHTIVHTHNGETHTHMLTHEHVHNHLGDEEKHGHKHENYIKSQEHQRDHTHG